MISSTSNFLQYQAFYGLNTFRYSVQECAAASYLLPVQIYSSNGLMLVHSENFLLYFTHFID